MTQEQRIDKTIEIAARLYGDILANIQRGNVQYPIADIGRFSVGVAKAIISEAEKEDTK